MRVAVIRDRRWKRALPHFDVRICPACGALVFRQEGQERHLADHERTSDLIDKLTELAGIQWDAEEWTWTAVVEGSTDDLGAIEQ